LLCGAVLVAAPSTSVLLISFCNHTTLRKFARLSEGTKPRPPIHKHNPDKPEPNKKSAGDVKIFWQNNCGKMPALPQARHLATIILPTPIILSLIDFVLIKFSVQF